MSAAVIDPIRSAFGLKNRVGDQVWAIADQMLISGTNFVTMILMARGLNSAADFGVFVLVYSILLFSNSIQMALVTQPHNVLGVSRIGREYVRYTSSTAFNQLGLVLVLATLVLIAWGISRYIGWQDAPMLLAMAPTIIAWQLQEFMRRVLYTERRTSMAFALDVLAYGGQALAISALWWNNRLTGSAAFYAITAASTFSVLIGFWKLKSSLALQYDLQVTKENWHFGKWLAGGYLVGNWLSSQLLVFLAAGLLGTWAAGILRAIHTVFGPMRILAQAFTATLPTKLARTLRSEGPTGFGREVARAFLVVTPLFGIYCLLVALLSGQILTFAFGQGYAGYEGVLVLYSVSAFVSYLAIVFSANLRATGRTRSIFMCELYATLFVVPVCGLLIPLLGIYGVVFGMIFTDVLLLGLYYWTYRETMSELGSTTSIDVTANESSQWISSKEKVISAQSQSSRASRRGEMLLPVLNALDLDGIPYCVLHGYRDYPAQVTSDVDCIMPETALENTIGTSNLRTTLTERIGRDMAVVQWLRGGAHGIVLRKQFADGTSEFLQLDVSDGCHLNKRILFYSGDEILQSRRRYQLIWVPATKIEFGCYLIRRITKRNLSSEHAQRLSQLYQKDRRGCREQIERLLGRRSSRRVELAAVSGDWSEVQSTLIALRRELLLQAARKQPWQVILNLVAGILRRTRRWFKPSGFHLVLLGPDGAGKSSVASGVQQALSPVFLESTCRSFPPRLLNRQVGNPSQPHDIPPRSPFASVLRAILYWWIYYAPGYYFTIYPALVRSSLVIHDRHVIDCLVDPKRYRYAGPAWLLRSIWRWMPKPHLVVLLDVPAEILQSRKQEVSFEVSARQRTAYRELVEQLPNGKIVDGAQSFAQVVSDVNELILQTLTDRLKNSPERVPNP
ncbi:MAG: hypothetical protein SGI77_05820 [Pirellulaceae bacterium]|nr:hypothetical protein [Pirellulaceae bacterium]